MTPGSNQTSSRSVLSLEDWAKLQMENCSLCPRDCHVNRAGNQQGFCREGATVTAARAALHPWEEPCISGSKGSGTVFFGGCNLQCIFCQNYSISALHTGKALSLERLSEIFLSLQDKGAHNINLVTPSHFLPQIALALKEAKRMGLSIPIVYNTGSFEKVSSLQYLEGLIDIYLPDLKFYSCEISNRFCHTPDYFDYASKAIAEMYRQVGSPLMESHTGLLKKGVIVRHLVLPGCVGDTKKILRYLHETYHNDIYISLMNQYTPMPHMKEAAFASFSDIDRRVTEEEYRRVLTFADKIGIEQGFVQEGDTAKESFIPSFRGEGL